MRKICFIRHGETEANKCGIVQGWGECSLNDIGIRQVQDTANRIKSQDWDYILSSDLVRARESAQIVENVLKVPVFYSDLLREKKPDSCLCGKKITELESIIDINGDGESYLMFFKRVKKIMKFITEVLLPKNIVIISHEEFIRYAITILNKNEDIKVLNGSEFIIKWS